MWFTKHTLTIWQALVYYCQDKDTTVNERLPLLSQTSKLSEGAKQISKNYNNVLGAVLS